jgi:hypothetical protein
MPVPSIDPAPLQPLNTTTKWADAYQDNLVLGLIIEAAGRRVLDDAPGRPAQLIAALPYING